MNKKKKIIIVIVLILLVFFITMSLLWYLSRRTSQNNGTPPMTFRKFLAYKTGLQSPEDTYNGEYGSDFTNNGGYDPNSSEFTPNGNPGNEYGEDSMNGEEGIKTETSQFTNSSTSPDGVNSGTSDNNGNNNGGVGYGNNGTSTGAGAGSGTGDNDDPIKVTGGEERVCGEADVNINFTAEEIAQLQDLQNRFYAVAKGLHTDADVATQIANYDTFKIKQKQIDEFNAFCQRAAPIVEAANPVYAHKVPTPFWYEPSDIGSKIRINAVFASFVQNRNTELIKAKNELNSIPNTPDNEQKIKDLQEKILSLSADLPTSSIPLGYLSTEGKIGGNVTSTISADAKANGLRSIEQVLRLNLW